MVSVLVLIEQAFCRVQRGQVAALGLLGGGENEFVTGAAFGVSGLTNGDFDALEHVVGGDGGIFADALDHAVLCHTIFRRQPRANRLHRLTENTYRPAEDHLLRW